MSSSFGVDYERAEHRIASRRELPSADLLPVAVSSLGGATGLTDSDHVHDLVEPAIVGQGHSMSDHLPTGGLDMRDASVGGEVRVTA